VARFLTTVPNNLGYVNLGLVQSYPTGGSGPTAYGPTSYYGSDPLPARDGDSVNTAIDLGDFSPLFRTISLTGEHGGLSRKQSTFYKLTLRKRRSLQVTQNYSQFAYTQKTNRNTLIAFYKVEDGTHRRELPINNDGYVINEASIDVDSEDNSELLTDYPNQTLEPGNYMFVITNDIRYQETEYSVTISSFSINWRFVTEVVDEAVNFDLITTLPQSIIDFGSILAA
jgi:hypothetical protein